MDCRNCKNKVSERAAAECRRLSIPDRCAYCLTEHLKGKRFDKGLASVVARVRSVGQFVGRKAA